MRTKDKFEEVKVKMVMKLKELSCCAAIEATDNSAALCSVSKVYSDDVEDLLSAAKFYR